MISMTGFASANFTVSKFKFYGEIKSYNHKYLDVFIRFPKYLSFLELSLKKEIAKYARRGRVEVFISIQENELERVLDITKIDEVIRFLDKIKKEHNLKGSIGFQDIFLFKDFLMRDENFLFEPEFEQKFITKFGMLLKSFLKSKLAEGKILEKDILKRLTFIEKKLYELKKEIPKVREKQKEKIVNKFKEIFQNNDNIRLEQEIVYLLDKIDVSEEITRIDGHLKNFKKTMKEKECIGKKLDFYLQEILRELNTLTVKSQDYNISQIVIELKTETEKIREQIQNVE